MNDDEAVRARLAEPFPQEEVEFRPGAVAGARALPLAYLTARAVMNRLDDVLGVAGWQDKYVELSDGCVRCCLRCRLGGEWVLKQDVGGPSDQPDKGDKHKSAYSDALKRAAVKFGIGRYLYYLDMPWCDYDPQKKRFVREPQLPPQALPKASAPPKPPATPKQQAAMMSPQHVRAIQALLSVHVADGVALLRHFGVSQLEEIPDAVFPRIKQQLQAKPLREPDRSGDPEPEPPSDVNGHADDETEVVFPLTPDS